jgi:hypothetical protein
MSDQTREAAKPQSWSRRLGAVVRWLHTYVSLLGFLALLFFAVTGFTLNHAELFHPGAPQVRETQGRLDPALLGRGSGATTPPPAESAVLPPLAEPFEEPAEAPMLPEPFEEPAAAPPTAQPVEEAAAPPPLAPPGEDMAAPPPVEEAPVPVPHGDVDAAVANSAPGGLSDPPADPAETAPLDRLAVAETLRSRHGLRGAVVRFTVDPFQCIVSFQRPGYRADVLIDRTTGEYLVGEVSLGALAVLHDLHRGKAAGAIWSGMIDLSAVVMAVASITGLALLIFYRRRRLSGLLVAAAGTLAAVLVYVFFVP